MERNPAGKEVGDGRKAPLWGWKAGAPGSLSFLPPWSLIPRQGSSGAFLRLCRSVWLFSGVGILSHYCIGSNWV